MGPGTVVFHSCTDLSPNCRTVTLVSRPSAEGHGERIPDSGPWRTILSQKRLFMPLQGMCPCGSFAKTHALHGAFQVIRNTPLWTEAYAAQVRPILGAGVEKEAGPAPLGSAEARFAVQVPHRKPYLRQNKHSPAPKHTFTCAKIAKAVNDPRRSKAATRPQRYPGR